MANYTTATTGGNIPNATANNTSYHDYTQQTAVSNEATAGMTGGVMEEKLYDKVYTRFDEDDIVQSSIEKLSYELYEIDSTTIKTDPQNDVQFKNIAKLINNDNIELGNIVVLKTTDTTAPHDITRYPDYYRYQMLLFGSHTQDTSTPPNLTFMESATDLSVIDIKRSLLYDGLDFDDSSDSKTLNLTIDSTDISSTSQTVTKLQDSRLLNHIGKVYTYTANSTNVYVIPKLGLIFVSAVLATAVANSNLWNVTPKVNAFKMNVYENVTKLVYFCRLKNKKFNYSNNPTWVDDNNVIRSKGNPTTYVTTIGLYSDSNELLAIAKLSKPAKKSFSDELLIKTEIKY